MSRVSDGLLESGQILGVTLDRYQELMNICPCAFNGIEKTEESTCCDCAAIWGQGDRDALAIALGRAEEMREGVLGYHVSPKYISEEMHDYVLPAILNRKHLITVGVETTSNILLGAPVTLSAGGVINDPVTIVVATTVTDSSEIRVYYPGETVEIRPSKVTIAAGNATILIPRCRLLHPDNMVDCAPWPLYDVDANFLTSVDVKRVYMDTTKGADFVWFGNCLCNCSSLTESTQSLYPRIRDKRLAIVDLWPANYSVTLASWQRVCCMQHYCTPEIRISYKSGKQLSFEVAMNTIRLAHSLLSDFVPDHLDLCECWKEDRLPAEKQEATPYGNSNGAVKAWMADSLAHVGRGGKFPRLRD